jgi:hypothetical protein
MALAGALLLVAGTVSAWASFELIKPLVGGGGYGVAVNETSGNVYVATRAENEVRVFSSRGVFLEALGAGVVQFSEPRGVAVDQATGDIYVLNAGRAEGEGAAVQVLSAGGALIGSFGVHGGGPKEPVSSHPELIRSPLGIAVDDTSGDVYIAENDENRVPNEGRVMVFKPVVPSDFSHYEYAGDFATGLFPLRVATDFASDVFVSNGKAVFRFGAGGGVAPVWKYTDEEGVLGMTVNPETGNVFYYTYVNNTYHELDSSGVPVPSGEWKGVRLGGVREEETEGLAFNPGLVLEKCVELVGGRFGDSGCAKEGAPNGFELVKRPRGVLYAVDPGLGAGLIWAEPPVFEPAVESEFTESVGTGSVVLGASIDPHGVDTHYRFQYGLEDCSVHACQEAPVPLDGDAGSGGEPRKVIVGVTGLAPGVTYHFRVVAYSLCHPSPEESVRCTVEGPDQTFTTFAATPFGPPDGRVFELVSPPVKYGGEVFPLSPYTANCKCMPGLNKTHFPMQSTPDGGSMVYEGDPFAATGGAAAENEYLATRMTGGWSTRGLSPELESKETNAREGFKAFSSDLSRGVLYQISPSLGGAPAGYPDLYLQDTSSGGLRPLVTETPSNVTGKEFALMFAGSSSDFSHVIFSSNGVLATESELSAPPGGGLYEWVNGSLRLVNILPGETTEPGAVFGSGDPNFSHAISADGSRIFWTDTNGGGGHSGRVYVRVNGEKTLEVPESGAFVTASVDGSRVLLSDGRVYEVGGKTVVEEADLTSGSGGFQGILGASDDLSVVDFVDTVVLTGTEENGEGAKAQAGKDNLYAWRSGSIVFVGTLTSADNATDIALNETPGNAGDWSRSPSTRTAQVTPDGRYLAFMSSAGLTGVDGGVFEVYEYDTTSGGLVCVSCNPTGEQPVGPSALSVIQPRSGFVPQPSNLSVNGRLFFDSYDQLSPLDSNGAFGDVYEYEPNGLGTCTTQAGCVSLISSGTEETNSNFVNATPSGSDAFFTTRSRLVPQDQDDLVDLYDARIGGTPPPQHPPPPCVGESCKGPSSSPPLVEALPSTIITGLGNIPPPPPVTSPPRAQLLAKALRACRKARTSRTKRVACEKHARKRYGTASKASTTSKPRIGKMYNAS